MKQKLQNKLNEIFKQLADVNNMSNQFINNVDVKHFVKILPILKRRIEMSHLNHADDTKVLIDEWFRQNKTSSLFIKDHFKNVKNMQTDIEEVEEVINETFEGIVEPNDEIMVKMREDLYGDNLIGYLL